MNDYLEHYNHNHDALGRFARSVGSAVTRNKKLNNTNTSASNKKTKEKDTLRKFKSSKRKASKKVDVKKANEVVANNKKGAKSNNTKLSDSERKRLVESGSAKEVSKNKDKLSNRELESAINRLQKEKINRMDLEKKLSDLASPENQKTKKSAIEKLESMSNTIDRANSMVNTGVKAYDTFAKIHNARNPGDKWIVVSDPKTHEKAEPRPWVKKIAESGDAGKAISNFAKMTKEERLYMNESLRDYKSMSTNLQSQKENDKKHSNTMRDYDLTSRELSRREADMAKQERDDRLANLPINTQENVDKYKKKKKKKDGDYYYDSNGNRYNWYG